MNHRLILCETAKHARVHPRSKVRQAWIVSGAMNISTRTYITHHQQGCLGGGGAGRPETSLVYTVPNTDNGP